MTPTPQQIDEKVYEYVSRAFLVLEKILGKKIETDSGYVVSEKIIEIAKLIQSEEHHRENSHCCEECLDEKQLQEESFSDYLHTN